MNTDEKHTEGLLAIELEIQKIQAKYPHLSSPANQEKPENKMI